ncbi:Patatin-like phospholipase domain protein [Quillaja saponaria]|uniref:Patatin-like phospholipase domain protein n=1 Tax=Quillaja saponaria TaxID=32244 RepID=A0AAD7LWK6_QUISA|nr:Patatin-like phospholipase domain protein [Quillaja saponaria]
MENIKEKTMLDPGREEPTNPLVFSDIIGYRNYNYNSWEAINTAQSYSNFGTESEEVHYSSLNSPPLWKTTPPRSSIHPQNHYQSQSQTARVQAIARGQKELMEMVTNMPESSYELSLKDLVDHSLVEVRQESREDERHLNSENVYRKVNSKKIIDHKAQIKRNESIQSGGFYLKMVFPTFLCFGSKKKKKKKNENKSAKVSPRPSVYIPYASSGESESGRSSINNGSMKSTGSSSSSSGNSSRHETSCGGCWLFMGKNRRKIQK